MCKITQLKNGLRIVTTHMKQRESIAIGFWVNVGGRHEDDSIKGAAHFLEHIVFKQSQKYSCEQIKSLIEGVGGSLNAFTSEEQTCFYAKIPSKHLDQTFDVLSDMVLNPKIAPRDMFKEKTVICEEIKMYHDLPQYYVMELLDGLLWPGHPLGKSLAGTQKTVMGITPGKLKKFHQTHYHPSNIVVAAGGKVSHAKVVQLSKKYFSQLKSRPEAEYVKVTDFQDKPRVHFAKKDIEQMHLAIGLPAYHETHKDKYALHLLSTILGGNMSSRLFVEVREKRGLAYSIGSSFKPMHDTGAFIIRAGVDINKITQTVSVILKQLVKIQKYGVNADEFKRGKDYLLGQLLLGLEDTLDHMLWVGESVIARNEAKSLDTIVRAFEKITQKDIKRVAREILDESKVNLAVVGPLTEIQEKELRALMKI